MARKWVPQRTREPRERSAAAGGERDGERPQEYRSPYSVQYETIISQGHTRPTPSFGSPALIWHVGIWPRRWVQGEGGKAQACDPHDTAGEKHAASRLAFESRRQQWIEQINAFLAALQSRSRSRPGRRQAAAKAFKSALPHDLEWQPTPSDPDEFFKPVEVLEQEIIPFTLWWTDPGEKDAQVAADNAMRICVHPEVNADYACISFYMDIGQQWNAPHSAAADPARGARRHRLLTAVEDIRKVCEHQLEPVAPRGAAAVDLPALPEILHSLDGRTEKQLHEALKAARNLLYVDIWEAFSVEMGCRLEDISGTRGEVFANFRGLIMSTRGMPDNRAAYVPDEHETNSVGTVPFTNFSGNARFNEDGAEPNAVVKAFWPVIRRVTPRADFREFIACGVLNWRAIYITALGSSSQYVERQEREPSLTEEGEASIRVPKHLLADDEKPLAAAAGPFDSLVQKRAGTRSGNNHPVRYLLLTKHEPHPRQIGRIAERINTMGTMRLYALKDWAAVRNADPYIRILGQELDEITKNWGRDRKLINGLTGLHVVHLVRDEIERLGISDYETDAEKERKLAAFVPRAEKPTWSGAELVRLQEAMPTYTPSKPAPFVIRMLLRLRFFYSWRRYGELLKGMENDLVADIRHSALYEISNEVETDLIDISSKLDELGFGAIGGLHFRLNRSAYYVREFQILLKTLHINNIQSWISYEQFVQRGLAPAFHYMAGIGKRLRAVRARLLTTTETIETSALVGQSAATRHNTAVLPHTTTLAILILLIFLASTSQATGLATRIGQFVYSRLPPAVTSQIDEIISHIQALFQ